MHSNGYSFLSSLMRSLTGGEMDLEAKNSQEGRVVGCRVDDAQTSHSWWKA